jgi:RNA polymerase sigma-70 factor (ECF subfamily)
METKLMEDWLLIIQCKRGNSRALGRIYRKYKRDCLLLAMALVNDGHAAEDIWHDVFIRFAQSIAEFHLKGQLKGYLMTCVANHAKNYAKSQKRRLNPESIHDAGEHPTEPLDGLILNEQTRQLAAALAQLPDKQREVILLHMHGKLTFSMIAHELGVSRNTAKSRYRYGLDKLQQIFCEEVKP